MENQITTLRAVRDEMKRCGVSLSELATASAIAFPHISSIFNGREVCGPKRRERIVRGLVRLQITPPPADPQEGNPIDRPFPIPSVRKL